MHSRTKYDSHRGVFQTGFYSFIYPSFPDLHCLTFIVCLHSPRLSFASFLSTTSERHRFLTAIKVALRPAIRLPRAPFYKLTSIIIIPLVRCSGSLRIFLAFPAICLNPFTWFSIPWPLSFMQPRMHECTSAQSFAAVNDIRMPALPMYLVTLLRSLHFAFILRLAAVFPWYFWISLPIEIVSRLTIFKRPSGVILSKNWKNKVINIFLSVLIFLFQIHLFFLCSTHVIFITGFI